MKPTHKTLKQHLISAVALLLVCAAGTLALAGCGQSDMEMEGGKYKSYLYANADEMAPIEIEGVELKPEYDEKDVIETEKVFAENPFIATAENNVSTFSADVDTASYTYFRKLVNSGITFDELQSEGVDGTFRTEEFINYFKYSVATPEDGKTFAATALIAPTPWNGNTKLLSLTLQAEQAAPAKGNNLVFLIDVSGSMSSADKLPLIKKAFRTLIGSLTANDVISIVTYSGKEEVVLQGCPGNQDEKILKAIDKLVASGSTNGQAGLQKAYSLAEDYRIEGGNNRIIMASDGDLNVGISSAEELKKYVEGKRETGIFLSVLGFGTGNYRDGNMESLADNGNGVYYYIDGESEAERVFGTDLFGTLYTVAKDVKMQITFDPKYIASYRLIGYENRMLAKEDFENDRKDAGDVGAGHQVTVCYELVLAEGASESDEAWMNFALRYKLPEATESTLTEYAIGKNVSKSVEDAGEGRRFLAAVIETTMLLHKSHYTEDAGVTLTGILEDLDALTLDGERAEFRELIRTLTKSTKN